MTSLKNFRPPLPGVFRRSHLLLAALLCATPLFAQLFTPGITEPFGSGPTYAPTRYVDSGTLGNESNDGLTPNTPWKFAPGMTGSSRTAAPGMVIAFKRGAVWRLTGTWTINGSGDTTAGPIVFTAYGDPNDPLPRITLLEDIRGTSGTWTRVGTSYVYYRTVAATVRRVYVNGVGLGEAVSNTVGASTNWVGQFATFTCLKEPVPNPNNWSDGDPLTGNSSSTPTTHNTGIRKSWKQPTGTQQLYLYSPNGSPNTLGSVEGIKSGVPYLVRVTNRSHVYFDRIAFSGGMSAVMYFDTTGTAPQTNVRVTNCDVRYARWKGIQVVSDSTGAFTNGEIKWNRVESGDGPDTRPTPNYVDYGWDPNGVQGPYSGESLSGGNDGITISSGVQNWVLAQNDVSNFWHTQIYVGRGTASLTIPETKDNIIEHNTTHAESINYGHAFAISCVWESEDSSYGVNGNIARYNYFYDTWSGNSIKGRSSKVYGNLFVGVYGAPREPISYTRWTADGVQVFGFDYPNGKVIDGGFVAYNTFVNCGGVGVTMGATSSYKVQKDFVVANNIIAYSGFTCYASSLPVTKRYLSFLDGWADSSVIQVDKNLMHSPAGTVVYERRGSSGTTYQSLAQMESGEPTWNSNTIADPQFLAYSGSYLSSEGDFRLKPTSPARGAAMDITNLLPESAGWTNMGCYQDANAATFVTAQALSPSSYNGYDGWKGMKITMGSAPIVVTELGRWVLSGNTKAHELRLLDASRETLGSASIETSSSLGGVPGQFRYGPLTGSVTLAPNSVYYVVSEEKAGQDFWWGSTTTLTSTSVATVNNAVKSPGGEPFGAFSDDSTTPGSANVPVSFRYYKPAPFVTGQTLSPSQYNSYTGFKGMKITVGNTSIVVTDLGRWVIAGNTRTHTVKVFSATGATLGSVVVDAAGATPGQMKYATLTAPVLLQANTSYYVMSEELNAGDFWWGSSTTLSHTPVATINGAVKWDPLTPFSTGLIFDNTAPDSCNVPVGFKYY